VLDRAFEDLGVLVVDYQQAHGRGFSFDHGLGDFLREFDAGRYPGLMVPVSESATRSRLAGSVLSLTDKAEHLTQEQKARLEAELAELEGPKRAEIVEAIKTARSFGDLSENFEYHAAKNEQGLLERRITILRDRLQRAEIVDEKAAAASSEVSVGSRVSLELEDGETMEVEISSVDGVSPESPLGQALLGAKVGDEVLVAAPRGEWRAKILSVGR
jgi:transcription elongation factor GreA